MSVVWRAEEIGDSTCGMIPFFRQISCPSGPLALVYISMAWGSGRNRCITGKALGKADTPDLDDRGLYCRMAKGIAAGLQKNLL